MSIGFASTFLQIYWLFIEIKFIDGEFFNSKIIKKWGIIKVGCKE